MATQQGERFTGRIPGFDARVRYAANDLAGSVLDVTIRVASLDTQSPDRDQALAGAEWFDFAKFPTATFRTVAIRATPAGPMADADLTIRGVTRRIPFPFKWIADGERVARLPRGRRHIVLAHREFPFAEMAFYNVL